MDELNKVLPSEEVTSESIEDTLAMLSEMGVNVVEAEEEATEATEVVVREETAVAEAADKQSAFDRTDDPVRMYLREMGSVELLSREGEIAIAKRIEAGRDTMIRGLCESALTFEAIMVWREELGLGRILLREVIDLEQTYGGQVAQALSDAAVAALEGRKACLLANHGVITVGADLPAALALAGEVENLAAQYCMALALGKVRILNETEMGRVLEKFRTYGKQDATDSGLVFGGVDLPSAVVRGS